MSQIRLNRAMDPMEPPNFLAMFEDIDSAVSIQVTASESVSSCAVSECSGES